MTLETLLILLSAGTVFFLLMGVYKLVLERKVQAREHVTQVIGAGAARRGQGEMSLRQQEELILKRRKKTADEEETFFDKLDMDLERANLPIRQNEFIAMCLGSAIVVFLLSWLAFQVPLLLAVPVGVAGVAVPWLYLQVKIWLRMRRAHAQFADVLDALVNCFKTGFGFNRAIHQVAENFNDPWGTEFSKMVAEMNLGANQETVLRNLARRVPSADVDLFVTSMIIQKETGGNLAELLSTLSNTCRERFKLKRKVSAISAQGKLSATLVSLVPFFLMAVIYVFLPDPVSKFLTHPVGIFLMVIFGVWMLIGIGVLFKMVQIEV